MPCQGSLCKVGRLVAVVRPALLVLCALATCCPAQAASYTVGPDAPYGRINDALMSAKNGDTVVVLPGRYEESLYLDKGIVLRGEGLPVVRGPRKGPVITVAADGVLVSGVQVEGSGNDMMHLDAGITVEADHCELRSCVLRDNLFGIYVKGAKHAIIEGCLIEGQRELEIGSRGAGIQFYDSHYCVVRNCEVSFVRDGVYFDHADNISVQDSDFYNLRYGVHYMYCEDNTFYGNTFRDSVAGVAIMYTRNVIFSDNVIINNRLGYNAFGLLLQACEDSLAERNVLINNTCGIFMENSRRNVLRKNLIAYNDSGIVMFGNCDSNDFSRNDYIENLTTLLANGKPRANWNADGRGSYYSNYRGYDADGDGIGDSPHKLQDAFQYLTGGHPILRLYLSSAAADSMVLAEQSFPVLPSSPYYDELPSMAPVSGCKLLERGRLGGLERSNPLVAASAGFMLLGLGLFGWRMWQ